jgi:Flp pilus assembly protein TadD
MKTDMPLSKPIRLFVSQTEDLLDTEITLLCNPEVWCLRAAIFIGTVRNEEALKDCEHALSLNQNCADSWSKKGYALNNLGRFEDAVHSCTRALALNGNDASAWYIKGVCLDELGITTEANEA